MLDTNLKAWQFEINANPSMNMHLERELPGGTFEKKVSKIDRYLKTLVINTGIKIVRGVKSPEELGIWEKIVPSENSYYEQFNMFEQARIIFGKLGGLKEPETITPSQFQKLGRFPALINQYLVKAQYDIIYKEIT